MKGFVDDIEKLTEDNDDFRRVLYTGHNLQLVLMAIQPGEEIGEEVHDDRDQFFRIEGGEGEVWIDGVCNTVEGRRRRSSSRRARATTSSAPATSRCGSTRSTARPSISTAPCTRPAAEADAAHEHFDGKTTE